MSWTAASDALHARVLGVTFDRLIVRLVELHAPVDHGGDQPVCCGCDQASRRDPPALWPCRTYTQIAASALGVSTDAVESHLIALMTLPAVGDGREVPGR
jgi:hypothetical protein